MALDLNGAAALSAARQAFTAEGAHALTVRVGEQMTATILAMADNVVLLDTGGGHRLVATLQTDRPLDAGTVVRLEAVDVRPEQVTLRLVPGSGPASPPGQQALASVGLPDTQVNRAALVALASEGLPVSAEAMRTLFEAAVSAGATTEADLHAVAYLLARDLPVTPPLLAVVREGQASPPAAIEADVRGQAAQLLGALGASGGDAAAELRTLLDQLVAAPAAPLAASAAAVQALLRQVTVSLEAALLAIGDGSQADAADGTANPSADTGAPASQAGAAGERPGDVALWSAGDASAQPSAGLSQAAAAPNTDGAGGETAVPAEAGLADGAAPGTRGAAGDAPVQAGAALPENAAVPNASGAAGDTAGRAAAGLAEGAGTAPQGGVGIPENGVAPGASVATGRTAGQPGAGGIGAPGASGAAGDAPVQGGASLPENAAAPGASGAAGGSAGQAGAGLADSAAAPGTSGSAGQAAAGHADGAASSGVGGAAGDAAVQGGSGLPANADAPGGSGVVGQAGAGLAEGAASSGVGGAAGDAGVQGGAGLPDGAASSGVGGAAGNAGVQGGAGVPENPAAPGASGAAGDAGVQAGAGASVDAVSSGGSPGDAGMQRGPGLPASAVASSAGGMAGDAAVGAGAGPTQTPPVTLGGIVEVGAEPLQPPAGASGDAAGPYGAPGQAAAARGVATGSAGAPAPHEIARRMIPVLDRAIQSGALSGPALSAGTDLRQAAERLVQAVQFQQLQSVLQPTPAEPYVVVPLPLPSLQGEGDLRLYVREDGGRARIDPNDVRLAIDLRLTRLKRVCVLVHLYQRQLTCHIETDSLPTQRLVQAAVPELHDALRGLGFAVDPIHCSVAGFSSRDATEVELPLSKLGGLNVKA